MTLDIKIIREMKQQLASVNIKPLNGVYPGWMKPELTVDGVVLMGLSMMHLEAFKDTFGEDAYQELLKQPRVPNPYGEDETEA